MAGRHMASQPRAGGSIAARSRWGSEPQSISRSASSVRAGVDIHQPSVDPHDDRPRLDAKVLGTCRKEARRRRGLRDAAQRGAGWPRTCARTSRRAPQAGVQNSLRRRPLPAGADASCGVGPPDGPIGGIVRLLRARHSQPLHPGAAAQRFWGLAEGSCGPVPRAENSRTCRHDVRDNVRQRPSSSNWGLGMPW